MALRGVVIGFKSNVLMIVFFFFSSHIMLRSDCIKCRFSLSYLLLFIFAWMSFLSVPPNSNSTEPFSVAFQSRRGHSS